MKRGPIKKFSILPSKTGKDIIELEKYAKLPRVKTYKQVMGFLEAARKSREVRVLFIVAEWGEGKTSIYEGLLKKSEVVKSDLIIPVSTKRLITAIKERGEEFTDTYSLGMRFFACLLYAIKDVIENDLLTQNPFNKIKIKAKKENESTGDFILNGIRSILSPLSEESRVFIFLDEFEDIVDEREDIQSLVISGLVELINGSPRCLCEGPYAGRLHLIIAATPVAYARIKSRILSDLGRLFGQRAQEVELEKMDRKSAYEYILGILKYCWNDELPTIPFTKAGMFNTIYMASLGNPRTIVNIVEVLLTNPEIEISKDLIKPIDPESFVSILSGHKVQVYGGEVTILDEKALSVLYDEIRRESNNIGVNEEKCIKLVNILLSNLAPISEREIIKELNLDEGLLSYLTVIGNSFEKLWGIREPFMYFKMVIKGQENIYSKIKSLKAPPSLLKIVSALEFYDYAQDGLSFVKKLFVPYQKLGDMKFENSQQFRNFIDYFTSLVPQLHDESEIIRLVDREIIVKTMSSEDKYIMLSPAVLSIFYPSPSIFFLDFIEDLDKRFHIGMKLMRNIVEFEEYFYDGVLYLLGAGEGRISVKGPIFESYIPREIEAIEITYSEIDREYKVRALILPLLKTSITEAERRIKEAIDKMELAGIPLLLVFSWNPLPNEVKGILETLLSPKRSSKKIFYHLEFPLNTIQCHQVLGYAYAKRNNYDIREEKWKVRASRILSELKFEDEISKFVREGLEEGYVIKQLQLRELRAKDVSAVLRTLLVTDGSIEERWKQLEGLEKKFRVYGKEFPINPMSIESEDRFKLLIEEMKINGLSKEDNGNIVVDVSSTEQRILAILKEYNGSIDKELLDKLFVQQVIRGEYQKIDIYLNLLSEREKIRTIREKRKILIALKDLEMLRSEFEKLRRKLSERKKLYAEPDYGYLVSIKKRNVNAIIMKECVNYLDIIAQDLVKQRFHPGREGKWRRKFILFKMLMKQFEELHSMLDNFSRALDTRYRRVSTIYVKRVFESLEKQLNSLNITKKVIRIKEKEKLEEKEKYIEEIRNRKYSREEIKKLGLLLYENEIYQIKDLYKQFKNCPVFDVKLILLAKAYEDLEIFINKCKNKLSEVQELLETIRELKNSIENHELFALNYSHDKTPLSLALLNWIRRCVRK